MSQSARHTSSDMRGPDTSLRHKRVSILDLPYRDSPPSRIHNATSSHKVRVTPRKRFRTPRFPPDRAPPVRRRTGQTLLTTQLTSMRRSDFPNKRQKHVRACTSSSSVVRCAADHIAVKSPLAETPCNLNTVVLRRDFRVCEDPQDNTVPSK